MHAHPFPNSQFRRNLAKKVICRRIPDALWEIHEGRMFSNSCLIQKTLIRHNAYCAKFNVCENLVVCNVGSLVMINLKTPTV